MFELIIKFAIALIFCCSMTILIFTMFKVPIKTNDKQITTFTLIIGFVNFYFKFILGSPYGFFYHVISFIILLMILRRYPILYAVIVSATGFICSGLIDAVISSVAQLLNVSVEQMINEMPVYIILHVTTTVLYLMVAFMLHKFNIGFSFVKRRFSGKSNISNANYLWGAMMIVAMIVMTFLSQPSVINTLNMYIIILVGLLFICSICYAYIQNKVSLTDRYGNQDRSVQK
ncbi:hypothetical protein PaecuDRAFT_3029 [Paenibacillus curdlanolyticus YK9]|uniref:Uncharacterized protein n=1 Tax=Paenibacillus curdlanolyticus YK9 TaxID=717606 RepID=E0IBJ0_9BACL|nr:hypothetical protein [Paenibacillus curdlanolyticus]EFM10070.1 hypothetical protein PaecuDRAFT_3029 [Paenibacillus curdlanolyticus YK9]